MKLAVKSKPELIDPSETRIRSSLSLYADRDIKTMGTATCRRRVQGRRDAQRRVGAGPAKEDLIFICHSAPAPSQVHSQMSSHQRPGGLKNISTERLRDHLVELPIDKFLPRARD